VTTGEIGTCVQHAIESRGFRPVANLTGHGLSPYMIHTPPNIPNVGFHGGAVLCEGMVVAIEPFATTGSGQVSEKSRAEIFQQVAARPVRLPAARRILEEVRERRGMPFSRRWLSDPVRTSRSLPLRGRGSSTSTLSSPDVPGSLVSQAEHTLVVTEDGCIVTTR